MNLIEHISMPDKIAYNVTTLPVTGPWTTSQILASGQPIVFTAAPPSVMAAAPPVTIATQKEVFDANASQAFCLRWNNYQGNLLLAFDQLLKSEQFVDVTLACDGAFIKAHKMVLSACSPYFQALLADNVCQHPVVIMKDIRFHELKAIVDFMYKGEINVVQEQIGPLLRVAETLKIRGLADVSDNNNSQSNCGAPSAAMSTASVTVPAPNTAETVGINLTVNEVVRATVNDGGHQTVLVTNGHAEERANAPVVDNVEAAASLKTPKKAARSAAKRLAAAIPAVPENLSKAAAMPSEPLLKRAKAVKVEADIAPASVKQKNNNRKSNAVKKNAISDDAVVLDAIKEETRASEMSANDDDNQSIYPWSEPSTSTPPNDNDETQSSDDTQKSLSGLLKLKAPSWTPAQLREAISCVVTQKLRFTQASLRYNIPKGTLYDNILGKSNRMDVLEKAGLDANDENSVLEFCCDLSVSPYNRRTRKPLRDVLTYVMDMKNCNRSAFDDSGKFAFRWWWAFCKKYSIASMHYDGNANLKRAEKNH